MNDPQVNGRHVLRSILSNSFVEALLMLSSLVVVRLAAELFETRDFDAFMVLRRVISFVHLPLMLGVGVALPRALALRSPIGPGAVEERSNEARLESAGAAIILTGHLIVVGALLMSGRDGVGELVGIGEIRYATWAVLAAVTGLGTYGLIFAIFRGRRWFGWTAATKLIVLSLLPPLLLVTMHRTVGEYLMYLGVGQIIASASLLMLAKRCVGASLHWSRPRLEDLITLLRVGAPRVPGEFAMVGLFALPVVFMARRFGQEAAAELSVGITVLNAATAGFAAADVVMMPLFAHLSSSAKEKRRSRNWGNFALALSLIAGGIMAGVIWMHSRGISALLLGGSERAWNSISILAILIPILASQHVARSFVDARCTRPIHPFGLVLGLFTFLAMAVVRPDISPRSAMVMGLVVSAAVTIGGMIVLSLYEAGASREERVH